MLLNFEMEVLKDIKNDLLKRQEIILLVKSEKNPVFGEIKKQISEKFSKPEEVIDIYNIKGSFGIKEFKIYAHIYNSKEDLEKAIYLRKSKKQKEADAKAKAEAIASEKNKADNPEEISEATAVSEEKLTEEIS